MLAETVALHGEMGEFMRQYGHQLRARHAVRQRQTDQEVCFDFPEATPATL
jgi:hypothetical protein